MNMYRVKVNNARPVWVKAPTRLEAIVRVLNRKGVRYGDVRVAAQSKEEVEARA